VSQQLGALQTHTTDTHYRHALQTHTTDTHYRHTTDTHYRHTLQTHTTDTHYRHTLQTHYRHTLQTHTTDTLLFISRTTNVLLFKFRCNIFIGEIPGFGSEWDTLYHIDVSVDCNWVATRWQQYSTHLHTNSTQNDTKKTIHRTTQQFGRFSNRHHSSVILVRQAK